MLKTKLRQHQLNNLKFHLSKTHSGDWSEMGVGKCLISLAKFDILKRKGILNNGLIVCPRSVMVTWSNEIVKHTNYTFTLLDGSIENKVKQLAKDYDLYIISYDSIPGRKRTLGILLHFLIEKHCDFLVLDEVTHVKNSQALRTKAIIALSQNSQQVLALSGTPITNTPDSVLTIYRAMDNGQTFGRNFFAARGHFFENRGWNFPDWRLREDREEEFKQRLYYNAVRLLKEECLDLPPKIYTERYAELSGIQKELYIKVAEELLKELTLPSGKVKIQNSLVKLSKLSQITSGFLYTDNETQAFPNNPKLDLLKETLEEIPPNDKVIIFYKWQQDLANISKMLDDERINYVILQGSVDERGQVIEQFNSDTRTRIFLSPVAVGAMGLNLTVACYVIYYSMGFSLIEYLQSQDRIHRMGQTKPCVYIQLLVKGSIDEYIYATLQQKVDVAKSLLNKASRERLKNTLYGIRNS